ncbi:hypothetical protein BCR32DRAFT_324275 [Anaeromyces robustus]|uniref:Uncharacterized protein n=1 Tax=Anaeromyces robustus TaxID=1754192 RepID=A0A1Y1XPS8_9FUNG|nr:hypothetical protein BCR32DRAFT_324275 [Anaeromyces robustus]|eukprot:ORX87747.1 hypothetical protein BCR32DRAFT_324275 [Anaeromyces robustus]
MKNFLSSLKVLRDSTKYVLDFLNTQNIENENNSNNCSQAFDVLNNLKRDVRTFTNTNFVSPDDNAIINEESKECESANLDNLHSQLSMLVDNFSSDVDILNTDNNILEPKLDIVISHQETLKSIDKSNNSQSQDNVNSSRNTNEENNNNENKNENSETSNNNEADSPLQEKNNNKNNLRLSIDNSDEPNETVKHSAAKNFLLSNTMPQTPEIERIKNYISDITDVDLNKLNNIEIIKLILDSLVQTCNELLQFKSDALSDILGTYPKSPLGDNVLSFDKNIINKNNNKDQEIDQEKKNNTTEEKEKEMKMDIENEKENENEKEDKKENENENTSSSKEQGDDIMNVDNNENGNETKKITINTDEKVLKPVIEIDDDIESVVSNPAKQKTPKDLLKELECLIILIHSLYENKPTNIDVNATDENSDSTNQHPKDKSSRSFSNKRNDSMSSVLTSNTELNSVINAIDSLLKSSPRFNNQCVQINSESKKKFQLMGVISVVDRMTRTRLNDQRATPNQLDHINRLIELLNKSLVRQYVEQRFTISPDKERKMELGRIQYLVEKSKNSRLSNQDWCSQKIIREKEIEDMFGSTQYKSLENQRFVVCPTKERDMYFNSLLNRVDKLDSYRLSNQDAVIKRNKSLTDNTLFPVTSPEADTEQAKRKEGPIKRLRRFSKSIKS